MDSVKDRPLRVGQPVGEHGAVVVISGGGEKIFAKRRVWPYFKGMAELDYPDRHWLNGALGWLDLRVPAEARAELQHISAAQAHHAEVLEGWWKVNAAEEHWEEALRVAELELVVAPDRMSGWVDRSYSLHELRRTQEAHEALLPALKKFPEVSLIPYNLACYACQLGEPVAARRWLAKAVARGLKAEIKAMALSDPDLALLRAEIAKW